MINFGAFKHILTFTLLGLLLTSCLPEQELRVPDENTSNATTNTTDDSAAENTINNKVFTESANFLQQGVTRTTSTLSIFEDYQDSILIRGNSILSFLSTAMQSSQSNYCIVTNFPGASGSLAKNVLVQSAKVRSYYSSVLRTKEYFLQIEPNNKTMNQNDCLTVSLTNTIQSIYSTTSIAFSVDEVCPSCKTNITSSSFKAYNTYGVEEDKITVSHLFLSLIPEIGSTNDSNPSCSINENCTSSGYNCCLAGQCVNHGEVKPQTDQASADYNAVVELLQTRPELIKNYSNFFYICPSMVPTDVDNNEDDPNLDPSQQASDLFTELTDLYNCLNPVIDEFSICKKDYAEASKLMISAPYAFSAADDDLTFSSINSALAVSPKNNISQVNYAGKVIYKEQLFNSETPITNTGITFSSTNDSLGVGASQKVTMQLSLPSDASNDIMSVYYKVDGTCEKLGSSLARCTKYYVQGQSTSPVRSSDHSSGNQTFAIPSYADGTFNVVVNVGGSNVPTGSDTWSLVGSNVIFDASNYPIYDNQEIKITYFVTSNVAGLTSSKEAAQTIIDAHCVCDPLEDPCNIKPVYTDVAGTSKITSYSCIYPQPDVPDAPLQETVYISAKSVPHKFFDVNGVNYNLGSIGSAFSQEGTEFKYTDGNNLKPNNQSSYIGFNEIYGSMNVDSASPLPPHVVTVDKGTTYDIFVDQGAFSTCLDCGTDYYSSMQKVFPNNFEYKGAGYYPDLVESRRLQNQGDHAGDDSRFGRACFVPATMIPWTHVSNSNVSTQRQNRLKAQHFMFANGYNKDWYGFDYGALIGSFDGVKWFAVGNQRRIKSTSNNLYLAINGYFGDLTISNTFKVTVSEMTSIINSGSQVTHDTDSDGAQCQRSHYCISDTDCITQLGYDYVCQNVSSLSTPWPSFDTNGNEMSGTRPTTLASLIGGTNGQAKRCVYRGKGAICERESQSVAASNSYTNSADEKIHTCSHNSLCAPLNSSQVFNTKISRYAKSPSAQNTFSFITDKTDTLGLAARVLGRSMKYYGTESAPSDVISNLASINVNGLCIPGKDVSNSTTIEYSNYVNIATREADKILNVGRTLSSSTLQDENYLSSCPATDEDGNYTHFGKSLLNDSAHQPFAIKNNISTNSLLLNSFDRVNFFNDDESPVTSLGYHKNTCLRAPGAKCFSDLECAPNSFISKKMKSITSFNGEISSAEESFWEEDLVCANSQERYLENIIYQNPLYETYEHHCCRETGKEFTYFTQKHENDTIEVVENPTADPLVPIIPGINQDINDPKRYTRTHTVYDKLVNEPTKFPSMVSAASQPTTPLIMTALKIRQYNTLQLNNERMCCTGHWVRSFADENGGGHKVLPTSQQNIDYTTFRSLAWNPNQEPAVNSFQDYFPELLRYTCDMRDIETADCEIKNISEGSAEEDLYLTWYSKLELLGIPQVLIETNNDVFRPLGDNRYDAAEINQSDITAIKKVMPKTIKDVNAVLPADRGIVDATYNGTEYYSASSYDNFEIGSTKLKKVYSESEFNCCIPTGVEVATSTTNESCCTGLVANIDSINRCCLPDFTDLSAYTNRYVSSEGAYINGQPVSDTDIDPTSGYIKKEIVLEMGSQMCCSGEAQYGRVIDNYLVPIGASNKHPSNAMTRRWLYIEDLDNAEEVLGGAGRFEAGVRWNNHVYCVPKGFLGTDSGSTGGSGGSSGGSGSIQQ
jgi:hypothetical protein